MHRVVIDTNIIVSGIIQKKGYPYNVVKSWENGNIILITSLKLIDEVKKVFFYPKIKEKFKLEYSEINHVVQNLLKYSVTITNLPVINFIKTDPSDNIILSTAEEGKANFIITGDSHLLTLKNYKGIEIITAKHFSEL
jgi:putative PIN family toxin of toxin-antitoxin system